MSLFGAMNTAISGLSAQSAAFSNISDNVANSQTVGYKRVDTSFIDYLTTSNATENDSGAVVATPDYVNNVQGTITQTDNTLGLAIAGQGFFAVSQQDGEVNNIPTFSPQQYYTRAGDFQMDKNGYLVNSAGNYLNGWPVNPQTGAVNQNTLQPIQVTQTVYNPVDTTNVTLSANLPATPAAGTAIPGAPISSDIDVYDALGTLHAVTLNWVQTAQDKWSVQINSKDDIAANKDMGTADVGFGLTQNGAPSGTVGALQPDPADQGSIVTVNPAYVPNTNTAATVQFTTNFGSGAQAITINLGTYGQTNGVTQFAGSTYNLRGLTQNGVPPGAFSSVTTQSGGDIIVNYDNGQTRTIAQVPVVTFNAPDKLQRQNGEAFTASTGSGTPQAEAPGTNGAGNLVTQSVESSNVDIAAEFSNVQSQLALVSNNVANASTPSYSAEVGTQQSLDAGGTGLGVRTGPATRNIDMALQAQVFSQNATVAGLQTRQSALQAIDAVQGTPGQNTDITSLLTNLQSQFFTLLNDPSNQAQQSQVVSSATNLARNINTLSNAYTTQRQAAQDSIVAEVGVLNTTLGTIGDLSSRIVAAKAFGQSTADFENQRDAAVTTLSQLVDVKLLQQPNGDVLVTTSTGLPLPTHSATNQLSTSDANMQPGASYPATIPPIMLGGSDVTQQLQGGQIGANITLRDTTLPTDQGELDEFAQNMANRFSANGLTLFTDPAGNVPAQSAPPLPVQNSYVGFAATIQVDQAVQQAPSLVRDGNPQVNLPPTQYAGFANVINAVLNTTFGSTPVLGTNTGGLGPAGTLSTPYSAPSTLVGLAATMTAAQAQDSASTSSQLSTEQAVQTTLSGKLSSQSGVNMDTEMSNMIALQNAYGANAKVIAAVQAMWTQLLNTVS